MTLPISFLNVFELSVGNLLDEYLLDINIGFALNGTFYFL